MSLALGVIMSIFLGKVLLRLFGWNSWRASQGAVEDLKQHARDGSWLAFLWLGLIW